MKPQAHEEIKFKYSENREALSKILKRSKPLFEAALKRRLAHAGYAGEFGIILRGLALGRGELTHGLRIGMPCPDFRAVDVTWHQGSNDSCLSLRVGAPHGVSSQTFHRALEEADKAVIEEIAEAKRLAKLKPKPEAAVMMHPAKELAEASKDVIDLAILAILEMSPDFGYFNREDDLEKLAEFGDPEQIVRMLVAGKHLLPISDNLLQLAPEWLIRPDAQVQEDTPPPAPAPAAAQIEPPADPAPKPPAADLLLQLRQAKEVVARAAQARAVIEKNAVSIAALEFQIRSDAKRLEQMKAASAEARTLLESPEVAQAQELMAFVGEFAKK